MVNDKGQKPVGEGQLPLWLYLLYPFYSRIHTVQTLYTSPHTHTMSDSTSNEPLDLIRLLLDEQVYIKLRGAREITGKLQAYDSHCNIVLSDATETVFDIESDELKSTTKTSDIIFVRGDSVILVSSPSVE